ncbi:MAG: preprotein translocase subunit YajC [Elusimicrobia bacterium]|nr:preprotein translocase subunit YajC [Elusimicrobiota bacterium]
MLNSPNIMGLVPFAAVIAIFYFLVIRPQNKQQKEHEQMLKDLKTGDKILTTGGLYGTITGFRSGEDLEVQFSQTVKLTLARSAVQSLVSAGEPAKSKTAA